MSDEKKEDVKLDEQLRDRIDSITTRNFSINRCPEKVYQDFVAFCDLNCRDPFTGSPIYHIGLKMLIDRARTDAVSEMLYRRIIELENTFELLRKELIESSKNDEEEKNVIKTMGRRGD